MSDERTAAERTVSRGVESELGRPLRGAALRYERQVESYLRAGARPHWMERSLKIERLTRAAAEELEALYAEVTSPERWREVAATYDFGEVNALIREHNEWYPVERDLPMHPRTGDYLPIMGRSFRREELGPAWILERFPPRG